MVILGEVPGSGPQLPPLRTARGCNLHASADGTSIRRGPDEADTQPGETVAPVVAQQGRRCIKIDNEDVHIAIVNICFYEV